MNEPLCERILENRQVTSKSRFGPNHLRRNEHANANNDFVIRMGIYGGGRLALGGRKVTAFFEIIARNYFLRLPESMIFISTLVDTGTGSDFSR